MKDNQLDLIFKALADQTRRRIIGRLSKQPGHSLFELCTGTVAEDGIALSRQTFSQHLFVLEKADLVEAPWKGCTKAHSFSITEDHITAASWLRTYESNGPKQ